MAYTDVIAAMMEREERFATLVRTLPEMVAVLRFNYHVMVMAVPLLDHASKLAWAPLFDDQIHRLGNYFDNHAREEEDHADWLKADLEELGAEVLGPDHMAACIAGSQWAYMQVHGPVPFLGYLAAMELRVMAAEAVEHASRITGGKGMRTIRHHAEVDVAHAKELSDIIECYRDNRLIAYNAVMTHKMYMHYAGERIKEVRAPETEERELWPTA